MKKYLLLFILIPTIANAEMFVCYDQIGTFQSKQQGDCLSMGICSDFNNQGMREGCFEATVSEYNKASRFTVFDGNIVNGDRVIDMKQSDIDAILAAEQAAQEQATKEAQKATFDTPEWQSVLTVIKNNIVTIKTVEELTNEVKAEIDKK